MMPLMYTACPKKERAERARSALRSVYLDEALFDHRSNELSGGQMQRVAIARALVNDPALILANEPTGNLDTATGEMVLATFKGLRDQGKTIVLITHEPDVAAHADRAIHIRDGKLAGKDCPVHIRDTDPMPASVGHDSIAGPGASPCGQAGHQRGGVR